MLDYFREFRKARIIRENIWLSADPSCNTIKCFATIWGPATPPGESLQCCRMLEMQFHFLCWGDPLRAPRGVAQFGDSSISPTTSRSSPASPSTSFCRCSTPFSPSSNRRRPNGKFARPAGLFLRHPNGVNRKPFYDHGGTRSLGLHHEPSVGRSLNRCGRGVGSRCGVQYFSSLRRAPTLSPTLLY